MSTQPSSRHASWLELFFDLIFVVAIAKTAHVLQHPHEGHIAVIDYCKYLLILVPIWWAWVGATLFSTRFDCDDPLQRIASLTQMFAIIALAAHINIDFDTYYYGFLYAYLTIRLLTILMYVRALVYPSDKKHVVMVLCVTFSLGALITASSAFFEGTLRYSVFYSGIIFEMIMPVLHKDRLKAFSVHSHHLPERFGLLTLILLGESITSLTNSLDVLSFSSQQVLMAVCGFIFVCAIWWGYFDNFEHKISGQDLGNGHGILYLHLGVYAGLGAIASMVRYAIEPTLTLVDYKILAAFGVMGLVIAMQFLHFIYHPKEYRPQMIINSLVFNLLFVSLLILAPSIPFIMVGATGLMVGYVTLEQRIQMRI